MSGNDAARTVALASTRAEWGRELVASFPRSLRRIDGPAADLVLIDGVGDWIATANQMLVQGARTLIVVEPSRADRAALETLADAIDTVGADIVLVAALADSAALGDLHSLLDERFGEVVIDGAQDDPAQLLLSQLRLLRALGADDLQLATIGMTPAAFVVEGAAAIGGVVRRIRMTGALGAGQARIAVIAHGVDATARLVWHGDAPARPVTVSLADATGLRALPAIHEGGPRHALRAMLASPGAPRGSAALRSFGRDIDLMHQLLGTA